MVFTSLDGETSVSLRPEDSKTPLLELCWAWRFEQKEHVDSQASVAETCPLRHRKVPSAAWPPIYVIDGINCFYKESAAALDWSGSECSRLPHVFIQIFSAVIITRPLSLFDIFYAAHSYSPACMSFLLFAC